MELILFDVDDTIINGQTQRYFLKYLYKKNIISFYNYLIISIWFLLYKIGVLNDPRKAVDFAYRFLKGKNKTQIDLLADDFFNTELKDKFYQDILVIISKYIENQKRIILISNAPDILVSKIASYLYIKEYISTKLKYSEDDIFIGEIDGVIAYGINKHRLLLSYLNNSYYNDETVIPATFYTDHISDFPLLNHVENKVVINPNKKFNLLAKSLNWKILNVK